MKSAIIYKCCIFNHATIRQICTIKEAILHFNIFATYLTEPRFACHFRNSHFRNSGFATTDKQCQPSITIPLFMAVKFMVVKFQYCKVGISSDDCNSSFTSTAKHFGSAVGSGGSV